MNRLRGWEKRKDGRGERSGRVGAGEKTEMTEFMITAEIMKSVPRCILLLFHEKDLANSELCL